MIVPMLLSSQHGYHSKLACSTGPIGYRHSNEATTARYRSWLDQADYVHVYILLMICRCSPLHGYGHKESIQATLATTCMAIIHFRIDTSYLNNNMHGYHPLQKLVRFHSSLSVCIRYNCKGMLEYMETIYIITVA